MLDNTVEDFFVPNISLPPVRGLVPLHNVAGQWFSVADIHRAIRHQCQAYQVLKLDLMLGQAPPAGLLENCLAFAREFQIGLSLRVTGGEPPANLSELREQGLAEICLAGVASLPWMKACRDASLPVRVETQATLADTDVTAWQACGVRQVTSFSAKAEQARERFEAAGIALAVYPCGETAAGDGPAPPPEYFADHQQYQREAFAHGWALVVLSPRAARCKLLFDTLRLSGIETPSDRWLVHFLRVYTPFFRAVHTASRLAHHLLGNPQGPVGAPVLTHAATSHPQYFDAIDLARLKSTQVLESLAKEARAWRGEGAPTQVFESASWGFDNVFHDPMPGVNQMHALMPGEKRGSKLPYLRLPFMVSVTFGGGLADSIGFAIGRYIRIACPMVATSHQLCLYVDKDGRYVLLRDGQPVMPLPVSGHAYLPARLPDGAHLQLAAWSPETALSVTAISVWERDTRAPEQGREYDVSVVLFSTRFSRRLGAVLAGIAHQRGLALERIQCIVAISPGLDAAEDVLDSMRRVYPELTLEAVALPAALSHAKGFALNECLQCLKAPLTVLIDSDILLPPDFLAAAIVAAREHGFIAPAGRAMLDADATARILLGETRPWDCFDELRAAAPEYRVDENPQGVPIGYCQVFRSEAVSDLRLAEYDHFQGADFEFGAALAARYGGAHRLELPVLHLDHGTRQWFGAQKQF